MANIVARIKLAPGENGYYDEKTDIYLNWAHPEADVPEGKDLSNLRRSVKYRRIVVTEGSLGYNKGFKQVLMEAKAKRTGLPLKDLMGTTPIVKEDGSLETEETEVIDSTDTIQKPTTTIEVTAEEPAKEETKVEEPKVEAASAKKAIAADKKVEAIKEETAVEPEVESEVEPEKEQEEEPLTTTPKSFRSLKVGGTKDITANKTITKVIVSDEKVATAVFDGMTVTVEGVKAGNVDITIEAGKESVVVSGVVVDA